MFRTLVFWSHLASGIVAGLVILVMSVTGAAIAFEHEILDAIDRPALRAETSAQGERLRLDAVLETVQKARPGFKASALEIHRDPSLRHIVHAGREAQVFVDPVSGSLESPRSEKAHEVLHFLEELHRWLALGEGSRPLGKWLTGVCSLACLFLVLSGLWLWLPRHWTWRSVKARSWFQTGAKGKARDWNWHNVLGLWSAPVLLVLCASAVVMSFEWGHKAVFAAFGETAPQHRDFRMMILPKPVAEAPEPGATPRDLSSLVAAVEREVPGWTEMRLVLPPPKDLAPLEVYTYEPAVFATAGMRHVHVDRFTGRILRNVAFSERSAGLQARVWVRFLHTGDVLGAWGKTLATLGCLACCVLVWTGLALSWRRWRRQ